MNTSSTQAYFAALALKMAVDQVFTYASIVKTKLLNNYSFLLARHLSYTSQFESILFFPRSPGRRHPAPRPPVGVSLHEQRGRHRGPGEAAVRGQGNVQRLRQEA